MADELEYRRIDDAAKDGRPIIAKQGDELARVRWHEDMWIYDLPAPQYHQAEIEPTHYRELVWR